MCNEAKRERGFGFLAHITLPDGATGPFLLRHIAPEKLQDIFMQWKDVAL